MPRNKKDITRAIAASKAAALAASAKDGKSTVPVAKPAISTADKAAAIAASIKGGNLIAPVSKPVSIPAVGAVLKEKTDETIERKVEALENEEPEVVSKPAIIEEEEETATEGKNKKIILIAVAVVAVIAIAVYIFRKKKRK